MHRETSCFRVLKIETLYRIVLQDVNVNNSSCCLYNKNNALPKRHKKSEEASAISFHGRSTPFPFMCGRWFCPTT